MRKFWIVCVSLLLMLSLAVTASASGYYVADEANLLTSRERETLNTYASNITETYGIGIYIMTVEDFRDYGEEAEIFDVLWNYYHDNGLGCGPDREGMILMLSMAERDFATFFYGEDTQYAFNSYGQQQLESHFLDCFAVDDWYGGFLGYLTAAEDFMAKAAAGEPVRENPGDLTMLFVLIAVFVSFVITRVQWMRMANVAAQKSASRYLTGDGLVLTHSRDQFTHRTVTRRKVEQNNSGASTSRSGASTSRSGGGGSGRSGKF